MEKVAGFGYMSISSVATASLKAPRSLTSVCPQGANSFEPVTVTGTTITAMLVGGISTRAECRVARAECTRSPRGFGAFARSGALPG